MGVKTENGRCAVVGQAAAFRYASASTYTSAIAVLTGSLHLPQLPLSQFDPRSVTADFCSVDAA